MGQVSKPACQHEVTAAGLETCPTHLMNHPVKSWAWSLAKALLAAAILFGVGRQFYLDLSKPELNELHFRPAWLLASALLYLAALAFSAAYWQRLLHVFGQRPPLLRSIRAYYVSQLGKYVPGKAWALFMRGSLVHGPNVRLGIAIITAFYEVLTTMAAGALVAAAGFLLAPPPTEELRWHPLVTGLLLLALCGIPLLPTVFNFLTRRLARRFPATAALPPIKFLTLLEGIATTALGWSLLALSLWSCLEAVLPQPPDLTPHLWFQLAAIIGLAYVAGFLAFILPGGVGVREYFLHHLLAFTGPAPLIAAAVLLLRLAWTAAELILAAVLYAVPPGTSSGTGPSP